MANQNASFRKRSKTTMRITSSSTRRHSSVSGCKVQWLISLQTGVSEFLKACRRQLGEKVDKEEMVQEFVTQRLRLSPGSLLKLEEIEGAFRACALENGIDVTSYTRTSFAKDLNEVVRSKKSENPGAWNHVDSKQRMIQGVRSTYWTGLEISSTDLSPVGSFAPPPC